MKKALLHNVIAIEKAPTPKIRADAFLHFGTYTNLLISSILDVF